MFWGGLGCFHGPDLGVKVTRNVAQYPLYHVTYSATKFEVATF